MKLDSEDLNDWLNGYRQIPGLPQRPDSYRRNRVGSRKDGRGVSVERSLAVTGGRLRKAHQTNIHFFMSDIFPLVELSPCAWKYLADEFPSQKEELLLKGGFHLFSRGTIKQWIHPSDSLFLKAQSDASISDITPGREFILMP